MLKSSNYWDKRAIERLTSAETMSEEYIKRIKAMYNQAYRNIEKELKSIYKNYSKETGLDVQKLKELLTKRETDKTWKTLKRQGLDKYIKSNYKSRISRLEQIQAQIYAKAKQIYSKEELTHTMCYKGVINNSYYKSVYDTQIGTGYDFAFNKIDTNVLDTMLNERWSGKNYSERIWTNTDILAESLSETIGSGLLSGQSIEKTAKQLRDRFNVGKYYSERLVRTETNHFNNEADAMAWEEMGIKEYVFVAVLDSRTSKMCQANDNKKYLYKDREVGVNYPPLHPNCRSTTRGYLGEEAEKQLKRRARNPFTGKRELIDNMSYKEWLNDKNIITGKNNKEMVEEFPIIYQGTTINYIGNIGNDINVINKKLDDFVDNMKNENLENSYIFTKSGDFYHLIGTNNEIRYPSFINLEDAIGIHNHPKEKTMFSFSWEDFDLFLRGKMKRYDGVDFKYAYSLKRTNDTNYDVKSGEILSYNNQEYYAMLEKTLNENLNPDFVGADIIAKNIANRYNIKYERHGLNER